jgi:hypothetical protein
METYLNKGSLPGVGLASAQVETGSRKGLAEKEVRSAAASLMN